MKFILFFVGLLVLFIIILAFALIRVASQFDERMKKLEQKNDN